MQELKFIPDSDVESLIGRFDRSSANALLVSLATELLRLGRAHAALSAKVAAMEVLQTTIDTIAAVGVEVERAIFPKVLTLGAADSLQGARGLYQLEYDSIGRPYRWTGPEADFSFQFFVDRSVDLGFFLAFGEHSANIPVDGMRCFGDGTEIAVKIRHTKDGYELDGCLPARIGRGGSVLTFVCPTIASPAEYDGSTDKRLLGVTFRSLRIGTQK